MSKRTRWVLIALGAVLLLGTPLAWWAGQPATQVGEVPEVTSQADTDEVTTAGELDDATGDPSAHDDASATDDPPAADTSTTDDAGTDDTPTPRTTAVATVRPAPPVSVSLPAIGVDAAPVVPVALDDRGAVEIPDDVREVGWYERGPRPGEAGNAFMTSHVDSRTQGRGVLFDLVRSQPGDPITVTHADGSTSEWVVVARERIDKGEYPMDRVFRFDGPSGLVIDTCGGAFDPATGSYENIDIVYAEPAP